MLFTTCVSMWIGCQAKGKTYSPVSRRIGFGAWHSTCSGEGSWSRPDIKSQKGFPVITPWAMFETGGYHLGEVKLPRSVSGPCCKAVAESRGAGMGC